MRRIDTPIAIVAVGAATMRAALILTTTPVFVSNGAWFNLAAEHLARTGEFGPGHASALLPPGYPAFLASIYAIVGPHLVIGRLMNALLAGVACVAVYGFVRQHFDRAAGIAAATIVALWPNSIAHAVLIGDEGLTITLVAVALWLGGQPQLRERLRAQVLFGAVLGWAVLTRPVCLILLPALGLYWVLMRRSVRGATVMLVPALIVVSAGAAWTVRNRVVLHAWIPISTNAGSSLWLANNPYATGEDNIWDKAPRTDSIVDRMHPTGSLFADADRERALNAVGFRSAWDFLRAHPTYPLRMLWTKAKLLYYTDTSGLYEAGFDQPAAAGSVVRFVKAHQHASESTTFRFYQLVLMLAAAALLLTRVGERSMAVALASLFILIVLFHLPFHAKDRFHLAIVPAIAALASITVTRVPKLLWCSMAEMRSMRSGRAGNRLEANG